MAAGEAVVAGAEVAILVVVAEELEEGTEDWAVQALVLGEQVEPLALQEPTAYLAQKNPWILLVVVAEVELFLDPEAQAKVVEVEPVEQGVTRQVEEVLDHLELMEKGAVVEDGEQLEALVLSIHLVVALQFFILVVLEVKHFL